MKVLSNEQAFLSVYINHDADDWEDRIVFIDPVFETLPPAIMVLKSLKYEKYHSAVFSAPKNKLLQFKEEVMSADSRNKIGGSEPENIMIFLLEFADEKGIFISQSQFKSEAFVKHEGFLKDLEGKFLLEKSTSGYNYLNADYCSGKIKSPYELKNLTSPQGRFTEALGVSTSLGDLQAFATRKPITKPIENLQQLESSIKPLVELKRQLDDLSKSAYITEGELTIINDKSFGQKPLVLSFQGTVVNNKSLSEDDKKVIEKLKELKWK